MEKGVIRKLVVDRGFGFLRVPGSRDIFFHMSILKDLEFDERLLEREVEFTRVTGPDDRERAGVVQPIRGSI